MWNPHLGNQPGPPFVQRTYTLASDISAMQLMPFDESGIRLGPASRLPRGAKIETCGGGFNAATLKVFFEGQYYYVFRQDLGLSEQLLMAALA